MLAAIGRLLGLRTVREAIDDPQLGKFVDNAICQEVIPAIELGEEVESRLYAPEILARFRNPFIEHLLVSICSNCSTKVGARLFPTIRSFMERHEAVPRRLLFGVAAVMLLLRDSEDDITFSTRGQTVPYQLGSTKEIDLRFGSLRFSSGAWLGNCWR
jgi:tagaturonate reductase